jgi:hypothetical protein
MPGTREPLDHSLAPGARAAPSRPADAATGPAIARPGDPRLAHGGGATSDLMHLQRTVGNAAVSSLVAPAVQRAVEIDEMSSDISSVAGAGSGPAAPAAAPGGPVTSDGGTTTISGPSITLDAAMTRANGVLHADVIEADTVIASSYTPGAGNLY